jgi:hypothetical protein
MKKKIQLLKNLFFIKKPLQKKQNPSPNSQLLPCANMNEAQNKITYKIL